MLEKVYHYKYLSEERRITLHSLFFPKDTDNMVIKGDIIFDYQILDISVKEFLEKGEFNIHLFNLSRIINTYNCNLDIVYRSNKKFIEENLYWISTDFDIMKVIDLLYSENNYDIMICLLQLTSIAENSLANIHLQISRKVPNMLTDLLNTKILENILTPSMINILLVFIGLPNSLNLRNLSWHGYLWDFDSAILMKYCKFLVLILWNIGHLLRNCQEQLNFSARHKTTKLIEFISDPNELLDIQQLICFQNCEISFECLKPFLQTIDNKLKLKNYYQSLCLMLPVFEFYQRMLFIKLNNLNESLSVAVSREYFVTEDIVISPIVEDLKNSENQFIQVMGERFSTLVAELLMYPNGPRLKDILSHGELTVQSEQDLVPWVSIIACILYYVINRYEETTEHYTFQLIGQWIDRYEPSYHTFAVIKKNLLIISNRLNAIQEKSELSIFWSADIVSSSSIFHNSLSILFRDEEIVTESGLNLKIMSNQIDHAQQQILLILDSIDHVFHDYKEKETRHVANFFQISGDLFMFLNSVHQICCKFASIWFITQAIENRPRALIRLSLVKLIKRLWVSCDKIRSMSSKHKWTEMVPVIAMFQRDYLKIDWAVYE